MPEQHIDPELPDVFPPWGAFPAEQYLIRHWDASSPTSPSDHRTKLIRDFTQLNTIPEAWDTTGRRGSNIPPMERVPTPEEVRDILAPWRPAGWRRAALSIWKGRHDHSIWLRTHYGDGDDKWTKWRETDEDFDPAFEEDLVARTVLDDTNVFNFGEHWDRVFDVLPELAAPRQGYSREFVGGVLSEDIESTRQRLRDAVRKAEDKEEEAEAGIGMDLQNWAVETYLIVADRKAFETDELRILWLDARGNIVRHSRLAARDVWLARDQYSGFKYGDSEWWRQVEPGDVLGNPVPGGVLGDKYTARGEMGRTLYGIEDLLYIR